MRSTLTRGAATALLPALGMLVLAGCGGNSDNSGSSPGTTPTSAPSTPSTATSAPTTVSSPTVTPTAPKTNTPSNTADPSGEQADVTINVTIANGKVTPTGSNVKVKAGQTVLFTAVSDTADSLHVHGYDKELKLTPGKPGSLKFTADTKGSFDVETHENPKLVVKLVVS